MEDAANSGLDLKPSTVYVRAARSSEDDCSKVRISTRNSDMFIGMGVAIEISLGKTFIG